MKRILSSFMVGLGLCLLIVAIWQTQFAQEPKLAAFERRPEGIMGTSCRLLVVLDYRESAKAEKMLDKAEFRLRNIESLASNWIEDSEISRFNASAVGSFEFSETNWRIIEASYQAYLDSKGAFDATCRPLIELWKSAGKSGVLPSDFQISNARESSSWEQLELDAESRTITKKQASARLDLGGVAKGYAIDEALDAVAELGVVGALVDVGGDIRVYGLSAREGGEWLVQIQNPKGEGFLGSFELPGGMAVCTSGSYARYVEIEGKRYSHIVDPVSGFPTERVPSVTVVAERTTAADVWATALSVLGPDGFELLPSSVEAELVFRDDENGDSENVIFKTAHFPRE